jgi:hypothetical protein
MIGISKLYCGAVEDRSAATAVAQKLAVSPAPVFKYKKPVGLEHNAALQSEVCSLLLGRKTVTTGASLP